MKFIFRCSRLAQILHHKYQILLLQKLFLVVQINHYTSLKYYVCDFVSLMYLEDISIYFLLITI